MPHSDPAAAAAAATEDELPQPIYRYNSPYRYTCTDCRTDMPPGSLITVHGTFAGPNTMRRIQCPPCSATGGRP